MKSTCLKLKPRAVKLRLRALGFTAFLLSVCWSVPMRAQKTIHVPADQPTIQAGIDAAGNGDTVLVAPGTYTENINFNGKAITLTSGATSYAGAAATIISAAQQGPAVTFSTNEPMGAVLNGFTIQDAYALFEGSHSPGAGIFIVDASPTITNNLVTKNACGIVVTSAGSPLIQGNDLNGNSVISPAHPNQELRCETPTLNGFEGAGLNLIEVGNVRVIGNVFENNVSSAYIEKNYVGGGVGGIYITYGTQLLLQNNIFRNNIGYHSLTGYYVNDLKLTMIQNLFEDVGDVGLFGYSALGTSTLTQVNDTVYTVEGIASFGPLTIANSIVMIPPGVVNDGDNDEAALACIYNLTVLDHDDAYWDNGPALIDCESAVQTGELAVAAQFVDPAGGDFHELPTSPTVAAGDINAPELPATDLDGKNRTVCGEVDMGVYQLHPSPPIALSSAPNPSVGGTTVTLAAALTGNCNVPTGILSFYDGSNLLGTSTLNGEAKAGFATAALTVGKHNLTATYPGDFNFNPSTSNTVQQVVTGYPSTTTLSVAPNPSAALHAITLTATVASQFGAPTGTVSFYAGTALLATASLQANDVASGTVDTLVPGTYSITAVYNASTQFAASTSNAVAEIVTGNPTATTLSVQPNPAYVGQTVTMVATITAGGAQAPSGSVAFYDRMAVLGQADLVASPAGSGTSTATFTTSTLAAGTHPLSASIGPQTVFLGSASQGVEEVILPSTFAIALSPASITMHPGEQGMVSIQLQSLGTFAGPVALSYRALPTNMLGTLLPQSVTLAAGGSGSAALTLEDGTRHGQAVARDSGLSGMRRRSEWPLGLAAAALLLLPLRRRCPKGALRLLLLCAAAALAQTTMGCGSSSYAIDGVAPGSYAVPVIAMDVNGDVQTATLTVVVLK